MEDVFSRLLGRKTREPTPPPDPLTIFTDAWEQVKAVLAFPDERMLRLGISSTVVPAQLQAMVDALVSETNGSEENETGACLEFLLKNDVLSTLERISENDRPMGIRAEVLNAFNLLVALLDEKFLVHNAVHRPLRRLLRSCVGDEPEELLDGQARVVGAAGAAGKGLPSDYEKDLLELMCMLCKRIRSYPSLLMIFFHDKSLLIHHSQPPTEASLLLSAEDPDLSALLNRVGSPTPSAATGISSELGGGRGEPKKEFEFLLFSYLLRFVHRESPIGEFSRAGILFLIDVAFSPGEDPSQEDPLADTKLLLAEFMLDGDFCEVLGACLGAVYSLLPTKLVVRPEAKVDPLSGGGMVLGGSGLEETEDDLASPSGSSSFEGAELSTSPTFQDHLDTYLKFLEFIQDVVKRGSSKSSSPAPDTPGADSIDAQAFVGQAMSRAIVGCVKSTFLEHILYPSILECSDADGSAVAVISYIDVMLSTLEPTGSLSEELLKFLLADDDADEGRNGLKLSGRFGIGAGFVVMPHHTDGLGRKKQALKEVKANRRKSSAMILLENLQPSKSSQYFTSQGRFSLKDLLLDNIASSHPETSAASLKLLNTVLNRHATVGLRALLAVLPDPKSAVVPFHLPPLSFSTEDDEDESLSTSRPESPESDVFVYPGASSPAKPSSSQLPSTPPPTSLMSLPDWILPQPTTTSAIHARETELYLSLVAEINSSDPSPLPGPDHLPSNYNNYLNDAQAALSSDQTLTSFQLGLLSASDDPSNSSSNGLSRHFKLNPSDPLLRLLLDGLREFFVHSPEENLALTGVLASIALCADLSLEGWLVFPHEEDEDDDPWAATDRKKSPSGGEGEEAGDQEDDDDELVGFGLEEKRKKGLPKRLRAENLNNPFTDSAETQPILYILFRNLVRKLERYRLLVPEFDHYLSERRQGLLFEETMSDLLDVSDPSIFSDISSSSSSPFARPRPPTKSTSSRSVVAPPSPAPNTTSSSSLAPPTTPKSKPAKSKWSFLSPSKKTPSTPSSSTPVDSSSLPYTPRRGGPKSTPTSTPHATHYQVTSAMKVERLVAESPQKGMWSPAGAAGRRTAGGAGRSKLMDLGEEAQFGLGSDEEEEADDEEETLEKESQMRSRVAAAGGGDGEGTKVSLSHVLDNVVILEECLKELVAITVVRLSSGVDTLSYA